MFSPTQTEGSNLQHIWILIAAFESKIIKQSTLEFSVSATKPGEPFLLLQTSRATEGTDAAFVSQALLSVRLALKTNGSVDATPACTFKLQPPVTLVLDVLLWLAPPKTVPGASPPPR